ncbi:MAG TPA: hypothetical protein VFN56_01310 [Candidatus Saccharimonadales bacterium]|nr:hypothetical protein [Candidatus Saccharimonadales bacterium]
MAKLIRPLGAGFATIITASLAGWLLLIRSAQKRKQVGISAVALAATLICLLLLLPLDISLRIVFVAKPGFLQLEVLIVGSILLLLAAVFAGKLQLQIDSIDPLRTNDRVGYATTTTEPVDVVFGSNTMSGQNAEVPIATAEAAIVSPNATPQVSAVGDNWQQGIATIQPTTTVITEPVQPVPPSPALSTVQSYAPPERVIAPQATPEPPPVMQQAPPQEVIVPVSHQTAPPQPQAPQIITPTTPPTAPSPPIQ